MKTLTMITRHGVKGDISNYTLITSDYQTVQMSAADLTNAICSKKLAVTNLTVGAKGIESTNGAIDKYTLINSQTGMVDGIARAVILDRVEKNDKLIGYTLFSQYGTIVEISVKDAVELCNQKLLANGKIRHTQDGDIVSAIGGNYPLRTIKIADAPKGEITTDILYFGTIIGAKIEYVGAIVSCTSAAEMSKITSALSTANAKVIAEAVKVGGQSVRKSLAIQRMGANSIYGVFDIASLEKLIKAGAKLQNKVGNITVSAVKYTNGEPDEATVTLNSSWKPTDKETAAEDVITKAVKEYTRKVVGTFGSIKIQ